MTLFMYCRPYWTLQGIFRQSSDRCEPYPKDRDLETLEIPQDDPLGYTAEKLRIFNSVSTVILATILGKSGEYGYG